MTLNYGVGIVMGLNSAEIKAGLSAVKSMFKETDDEAKKSGKSLELFKDGVKEGVTTIGRLGTVALGVLTSVALTAPSLAGAMSKIKVEAFKTTETIGRNLKPQFESFAQGMQNFNSWLDANPMAAKIGAGAITTLVTLGAMKTAIVGLKWAISPVITLVKALIAKTGLAALGIAGLGAAGGEIATGMAEDLDLGAVNAPGLVGYLTRLGISMGGGAVVGAAAGSILPGAGTLAGAGVGAAGAGIWTSGKEAYHILSKSGPYAQSQGGGPMTFNNIIEIDGKQVALYTNTWQSQMMGEMPGGDTI